MSLAGFLLSFPGFVGIVAMWPVRPAPLPKKRLSTRVIRLALPAITMVSVR